VRGSRASASDEAVSRARPPSREHGRRRYGGRWSLGGGVAAVGADGRSVRPDGERSSPASFHRLPHAPTSLRSMGDSRRPGARSPPTRAPANPAVRPWIAINPNCAGAL
jgi:hypothetical protein